MKVSESPCVLATTPLKSHWGLLLRVPRGRACLGLWKLDLDLETIFPSCSALYANQEPLCTAESRTSSLEGSKPLLLTEVVAKLSDPCEDTDLLSWGSAVCLRWVTHP